MKYLIRKQKLSCGRDEEFRRTYFCLKKLPTTKDKRKTILINTEYHLQIVK